MISSFILLFIVIMISISRIKIMYRIIKNLIPNKIFLKLKYFKKFKQNLSFKNPKKFAESVQIPIIASGGISNINNVRALYHQRGTGISGVIIGKAIYENRFDLKHLSRFSEI